MGAIIQTHYDVEEIKGRRVSFVEIRVSAGKVKRRGAVQSSRRKKPNRVLAGTFPLTARAIRRLKRFLLGP
jgi:hypothetical protein